MYKDFIFSLYVAWTILFVFWFFSLAFIYFRKPPKSKLTSGIIVKSLSFFVIWFITLQILS